MDTDKHRSEMSASVSICVYLWLNDFLWLVQTQRAECAISFPLMSESANT